jgi:glycosyltransferase involved in cell wall biosynthesis
MQQAYELLFGARLDAQLPMPSPIPLTVIIRTLNEADRIGPCLLAARHLGAELLVIDAGSTDETVAICQAAGARVITNPWPGFGPQRLFAEGHATHHHVLSLDADEIVTPAFISEVRRHFMVPDTPRLMIVRKAMVFPNQIKPPLWGYTQDHVLLWDRRVARTGPNPNQDKLEIDVSDRPVTVRSVLWHYSFRDWHHAINKANYVAQLAGATYDRPLGFMLKMRIVTELPLTFLKFYIQRRYCLGGLAGFNMAVITAFGRYARVLQMVEQAQLRLADRGHRGNDA